jgi:hypothetical protein
LAVIDNSIDFEVLASNVLPPITATPTSFPSSAWERTLGKLCLPILDCGLRPLTRGSLVSSPSTLDRRDKIVTRRAHSQNQTLVLTQEQLITPGPLCKGEEGGGHILFV